MVQRPGLTAQRAEPRHARAHACTPTPTPAHTHPHTLFPRNKIESIRPLYKNISCSWGRRIGDVCQGRFQNFHEPVADKQLLLLLVGVGVFTTVIQLLYLILCHTFGCMGLQIFRLRGLALTGLTLRKTQTEPPLHLGVI